MTYFCNFAIMISKNRIKLINSLETKKGRAKTGLFVAEGPKIVGDLKSAGFIADEIIDEPEDVRHVSFLQHPQGVVGIFRIPDYAINEAKGNNSVKDCLLSSDKLSLALDGVQDPGNVGTIIRIADWFGIEDIFCSRQTADCWSPKVIQATMGSVARVRVHYTDLTKLIGTLPPDFPIYGTLLDGHNIYDTNLTSTGLIIMGNEGNGISQAIRSLITRPLFIPSYPADRDTTDSLNVAIATAITCAEFRRRG